MQRHAIYRIEGFPLPQFGSFLKFWPIRNNGIGLSHDGIVNVEILVLWHYCIMKCSISQEFKAKTSFWAPGLNFPLLFPPWLEPFLSEGLVILSLIDFGSCCTKLWHNNMSCWSCINNTLSLTESLSSVLQQEHQWIWRASLMANKIFE